MTIADKVHLLVEFRDQFRWDPATKQADTEAILLESNNMVDSLCQLDLVTAVVVAFKFGFYFRNWLAEKEHGDAAVAELNRMSEL